MASSKLRVLLLGATGTIGLATARALLRHGHDVVCIVRPRSGRGSAPTNPEIMLEQVGVAIRRADPCDPAQLQKDGFAGESFDALVSCLASRTGRPNDAWRIDHQAHVDVLALAKSAGVKHFVLLSAICVQKPKLAFQHAKLAFEQCLMDSGLVYSIVRPTAFFKSLSGQLERVIKGKPFLIFGDGQLTACKPIGDDDLADFLAGCLVDENRYNRILPVGGPGPAITPRQQGEELFRLLGRSAKFQSVPVRFLDMVIDALTLLGKLLPFAADKAELARIGRYYASESMLLWDPVSEKYDAQSTPSYGTQTLFDAYAQWIKTGQTPGRGDHAVF